MAGGLVGTAYVKVTPDTSQFGNQLANGVAAPAQNAGRTITSRLGNALSAGVPRVASRLSSGLDTAFNAATTAASTAGSAIGRGLGRATATVLGPVARLRDGFVNSAAAASRFSGLSGTIGGKLRTAVDTVGLGASRIGRMFQRSGQTATTQTSNISRGLGGVSRLLGGIAVGTGIITIGKQAFQAASGIQQSRAALTGLYGNATQATDMISRMRKVAAGSPIEFSAFAGAAESLAYMGIKGDQAQGVITNLGDALVGAGKGSESMQPVTEALLDMQNQGKATADNVNRISQAGVPAWEALATASGVSMQQIHKDVSDGKVSVQDMLGAIQNASGPTFKKLIAASDEAGGTFQNTWARVKDNVLTQLGALGEGALGSLAPMLQRVGDAVSTGLAKLPMILSQIGQYFAPLGQTFANLWAAAQPFLQGIGQGFVAALMGIGQIIQSVVGPALAWITNLFRQIVGALGPVAPILGGLVGAFAGAAVAVKTLSGALSIVTGAWRLLSAAFAMSPIGAVITAIVALVAVFVTLWNKSAAFRNFWIGLWNAIKSAALAVWNALKTAALATWNAIVNAAKTVFGALKAFFSGLWNGIKSVFTSVWNGLKSFLSGIWNGIKSAAVTVWSSVISFIGGIPGKILGVFKGAGTWLLNIGKDLLRGLWNGVKGAAGWIWDKFKSFFGNLLPGWVKKMLGIGSPSKVFADLGKWLPAGMAEGIDDNANAPLRSVKRMAGQLSDVAAGVGSDFDMRVSGSSTLHSTIAEGIRDGMATASINMDGKAVARGVDRAKKLEAKR